MADQGLVKGKITDEDLVLLERRVGTPHPCLRTGGVIEPWNPTVEANGVRKWAFCMGDDNPLYKDAEYARDTVWGTTVAPIGFEWSMGWERSPTVSPELHAETHRALRGVQLYHSGAEKFYYRPMLAGAELYKAEWLAGAVEKQSRFANRTIMTTADTQHWDADMNVYVDSSRWFVHAERREIKEGEPKKLKYVAPEYTDEDLRAIEEAYDNQYLRGADTLWLEDAKPGEALPTMVKGPLTITDMINTYMGAGWATYANAPYRLAYLNRKKVRGFYSKNSFGAWETIQRVHWDTTLAHSIGIPQIYDIGPMRYIMLCHYLTNFIGDDAFVYRLRYELRNFNYVGDVTWLTGRITKAEVHETLGPIVELELKGTNQRGEHNITGDATVLVNSRKHGPVKLPKAPTVTPYRSDKPLQPGLFA